MDQHKFLKTRVWVLVVTACCHALAPSVLAAAAHPYEYFGEFCRIGQRVPGTAGHRQARQYITDHLAEPVVDSFRVQATAYYNIYQRFPGEQPRIAFAAHWDSDIGCPGANDGGSGVAVLLALADSLEQNPPLFAVDLLFFDGEDVNGAELYGSNHFAANCIDNYSYVIVLDMVADRDLQIFQEGNSSKFFPAFVDSIWDIGRVLAPEVFVPAVKYYITDDHMSLIKYGIRSIVIIDFDYPYWDTAEDTADKCSRQSLDIIYRFALELVYQRRRH